MAEVARTAHTAGPTTPVAGGGPVGENKPAGGRLSTLLEDVSAVLQSVVVEVAPVMIDAIDVNEIVDRIDVNEVVERIDLNALIERVDLGRVIVRLNLDAILALVNAMLAQVDVNALVARIDLDDVLQRVDLNQLLERVDFEGLLERTDLGPIVTRVSAGASAEVLDTARSAGVGLDGLTHRLADRLLRRPLDQRRGPALLVNDRPPPED
jgi:hypothetical protein